MALAIQVLLDEHRVVQRVLSAMEATALRLHQGGAVERDWLTEAARFHVVFTDGTHHAREEGVLFKALLAHGVSPTRGPVATLLVEHNTARGLVQHLSRSAAQYASDGSGGEVWTAAALSYAQLLRSHVNKEERVLFPLVREVVPAKVLEALHEQYAQIDAVDESMADAGERLVSRALSWWPEQAARPG